MANTFKTLRHSDNVTTVEWIIDSVPATRWALLRADVHWDNPKCNRELELRHLKEARDRDAAIIDAGDLFCAMQGKYDKRADKSAVRPEHQSGDYLDRLVTTAIDYYRPFSKQFAVIGYGNHESSIRNKHETDLTERLVTGLNDRTGSTIAKGGYTGWVRFQFSNFGRRRPVLLWYMHGYGGGGQVTNDVIQAANRQVVYVENADIMLTGHTHDAWSMERVRVRLNKRFEAERRTVQILKTATYKDEYGQGSGGWHVETGKPPKPLGAWWIRFDITKDGVTYTPVRAGA